MGPGSSLVNSPAGTLWLEQLSFPKICSFLHVHSLFQAMAHEPEDIFKDAPERIDELHFRPLIPFTPHGRRDSQRRTMPKREIPRQRLGIALFRKVILWRWSQLRQIY